MTRRHRRLITVRYTNRPLLVSELDWPLEPSAVPSLPPGPQPVEPGDGRRFERPGTIGRELLDEPAAAPVTVGDDAQQRVPSGPLDSDYGHGWAA